MRQQRAPRGRRIQHPECGGVGRPLLVEALRLFELTPPSAEHASARFDYATSFRRAGEERRVSALLNRALEIAEAAGATPLAARAVSNLGYAAFLNGQVGEGQAFLDRGRAL